MKPILLVGEAQGENEHKIGKGFVGTTGAELLLVLHDAGVITLTSADRTPDRPAPHEPRMIGR